MPEISELHCFLGNLLLGRYKCKWCCACLWLQSPFWKWDNASSGWEIGFFVPSVIFYIIIAEVPWRMGKPGGGSYLDSLPSFQIIVQKVANCQRHTRFHFPLQCSRRWVEGRSNPGSVKNKSSFHIQTGLCLHRLPVLLTGWEIAPSAGSRVAFTQLEPQ